MTDTGKQCRNAHILGTSNLERIQSVREASNAMQFYNDDVLSLPSEIQKMN